MTTTTDTFFEQLNRIANRDNPMPVGPIPYRGYTITPVINHNPNLFGVDVYTRDDHPSRRVGKTVYMVQKEGYADCNYFRSLMKAKRWVRRITD
jgi:hypothetical protein